MKKIILLSFLLSLISFNSLMADEIQIEVSGIKKSNKQTNLYVAIYDNEEDRKNEKAVSQKKFSIDANANSVKIVSLDKLEVGKKYVINVFQDMNGNEKLDRNFVGFPKEPFGFSNNVSALFGPPSYKELEFSFSKNLQKIKIKL